MQLLNKSSIWTVGVLFALLAIHYVLALSENNCAEEGDEVVFYYKLMNKNEKKVWFGSDATITLNKPDNLLDKTLIGAGFSWVYPVELTGDVVNPSDFYTQLLQRILWWREYPVEYSPGSVRDRLNRIGIKVESEAVKIEILLFTVNYIGYREEVKEDDCGNDVQNKYQEGWSWFPT